MSRGIVYVFECALINCANNVASISRICYVNSEWKVFREIDRKKQFFSSDKVSSTLLLSPSLLSCISLGEALNDFIK